MPPFVSTIHIVHLKIPIIMVLIYISEDYDDVLADGIWQQFFTEKPEVLTREEKRAWLTMGRITPRTTKTSRRTEPVPPSRR